MARDPLCSGRSVPVVERASAAVVGRIALGCIGAVAIPFLVLAAARAFDGALTSLFVAAHLGF